MEGMVAATRATTCAMWVNMLVVGYHRVSCEPHGVRKAGVSLHLHECVHVVKLTGMTNKSPQIAHRIALSNLRCASSGHASGSSKSMAADVNVVILNTRRFPRRVVSCLDNGVMMPFFSFEFLKTS